MPSEPVSWHFVVVDCQAAPVGTPRGWLVDVDPVDLHNAPASGRERSYFAVYSPEPLAVGTPLVLHVARSGMVQDLDAQLAKCDGEHGAPACNDPDCWQRDPSAFA